MSYLKKKCMGYSISDLLKHVLLQEDGFVPEAIEIFRNELQRREIDIQDLLKKESLKTGSVELIVPRTGFYYAGLKQSITGNIYCTSNGLFFIPKKIVEEGSYLYGIAASKLGMLGLVIDEIMYSYTRKESEVDLKGKKLPFSLLSQILEHSYAAYLKEITHVICWKKGTVRINKHGDKEVTLSFSKSKMLPLTQWFKHHGISYSVKKTIKEIVSGKIKGKKRSPYKTIHTDPLAKRLQQLKKAFDEGLISEKEYIAKRKRIIDDY